MPKALILSEFKEYGDLSALRLEEIETPTPAAGEVLIEVDAFALNFGDFELFTGDYTFTLDLPARVGDECAGRIVKIGPEVTGFKVGDRVSTMPAIYGKNGVNGEFALYEARYCAHVPDNITSIEACAVWVSYFTAYAAMIEVADVKHSDSVLIVAGSSTAGIAAMQICKKIGARTIATSRTGAKCEMLLELGYDHAIAQDETDIATAVNEITDGDGCRVIYDPVGGKIVQDYKGALAQDAVIFLYGGMDQSETVLPETEMTKKNACLRPFSVFNYIDKDDLRSRGVEYVQTGLAEGWLHAQVGDVYEMRDWLDAMTDQLNSKTRPGKTVINVKG